MSAESRSRSRPVIDLDPEFQEVLSRARLGMLALAGRRFPLVNPAAFNVRDGLVWMTTSRRAVKLVLARRDPRAAFMVASGGRALLLQGRLEVFDPLSLQSQLRAVAEGPRFAFGLAGYALKNVPFIAGYVMDLPDVPMSWWPQNRMLLRLRPDRVRSLNAPQAPAAAAATIPGLPAELARSLARLRTGAVGWMAASGPVLAPALWAVDGPGCAAAWLPDDGVRHPAGPVAGALVVERHHAYRATRQGGAAMRGLVAPDASALAVIAARYGGEPPSGGNSYRIAVDRTTWWRGFDVRTTRIASQAEAAS